MWRVLGEDWRNKLRFPPILERSGGSPSSLSSLPRSRPLLSLSLPQRPTVCLMCVMCVMRVWCLMRNEMCSMYAVYAGCMMYVCGTSAMRAMCMLCVLRVMRVWIAWCVWCVCCVCALWWIVGTANWWPLTVQCWPVFSVFLRFVQYFSKNRKQGKYWRYCSIVGVFWDRQNTLQHRSNYCSLQKWLYSVQILQHFLSI